MIKPSVLIVDDDETFRTYVTLILRDNGYTVEALENGDQLIARLSSAPPSIVLLDVILPDVVLLDVILPDGDGVDIVGKIRAMGVDVPIIMLSGVSHVRTVVEAMKLGASDFLMKPFEDSALQKAIDDAVSGFSEKQTFVSATSGAPNSHGFVTLNPQMRRLAEIVRRVACTDVPILIAGESGVGKEVMARHAHAHSGRHDNPFVKVNCAAMPGELLESELFGYERGAFTGAANDKPGKFELAHTGTLLLDEIGEMSPLLQAKLLHVLQDGTFSRLGGRKTITVDARIIAATNIDIEKAVADGRFREDLYFRLNVIRVDLPPLRERREDIPALCRYFIKTYRERYKSDVVELPPELMDRFAHYDWPGNIRELENCIKRFLVLPEHHSLLSEFGTKPQLNSESAEITSDTGAQEPASLLDVSSAASDRAQRELVSRVLTETGGNRKQAAKRMNICYKALLNKLKRWEIVKGKAA
jgi:DNA-binding NtrC family response regulator